MIPALRIVLFTVIAVGVLLALRATAQQDTPNATRAVIGARQSWCTEDGRFTRMPHTGWLPTARCFYPVAVPQVRRSSTAKVARP